MNDCLKMKPGKVLIVDDDALVALNHQALLARAGYTVEHAKSLREAWSLLNGQHYDLLILDHDLPDGKGRSLIDRMHNLGISPPVIYLSAAPPSVLKEVGKLPAVRAVLTKPTDESQLVQLVDRNFPEPLENLFPRLINRDERRLLLDFLNT